MGGDEQLNVAYITSEKIYKNTNASYKYEKNIWAI